MSEKDVRSSLPLMVPAPAPSVLDNRYVEAGVQLANIGLPGIGALHTLLRGGVRAQREEQLNQFLSDLATSLNALYEKTESVPKSPPLLDLVSDPDFLRSVARAAEEAAKEPNEQKRRYLANFVISSIRLRVPDVTLRDLFWRYTRELTGAHIAILEYVYRKQRSVPETDIPMLHAMPDRPEITSADQLRKEVVGDAMLLRLLTQDLVNNGLLEVLPAPKSGEDRSARTIATGVGSSFLRFLMGEWQ